MSSSHLYAYVDDLQACGRYYFLREDSIKTLGITESAFNRTATRLVSKKRIFSPTSGLFIIVPLEYQKAGAPPASWFIDILMRVHEQPYYVGLLSAASLHGAAHQQPQEFQVITDRPLRPITSERELISFFTKKFPQKTPTTTIQVPTGSIVVSTAEATALDLIRYSKSMGSLNHTATVLTELIEQMQARKLLTTVIETHSELSTVQRLGVILDQIGASSLGEPMREWLEKQKPRFILLRPNLPAKSAPKNTKWKVTMNDTIEIDE